MGSYVKKGTYQNLTLAEVWNGRVWKIESTPNIADAYASGLWSVSCTRATTCTAVGYEGGLTLAEAWNGKSWKIQRTPNLAGASANEFYSVSCVHSGTCVAVATGGSSAGGSHAFAEIWNKKVWRLERTPSPVGSTSTRLAGVSCVSATNCTVVGGRETRRYLLKLSAGAWNGKSWRLEQAPDPSGATSPSFAGISCASASACIAVGSYYRGTQMPLAEAWNGKVWKIEQPLP